RFVVRAHVRAGSDDPVYRLAVLVRDGHLERLQVVLQLLRRARTDDGAGHTWLVHAPRQRELRKAHALPIRDLLQALDHVPDGVAHASAVHRVAVHERVAAVLGWLLIAAV